MVFNEDQLRNRAKNSAANMTVIRHMALNLIKQDKNTKVSIRGRRLKAGWDDACLSAGVIAEYLMRLPCTSGDLC